MANNTTAVIYVKEAGGRYFFVNRRFEEIFGLRADHIIGFTDHQIFPRHFADSFRSNDVEVLERNSTVEYEETAPHLDGLHTYISIKFPLRDQAGIPYALCGISTDISERKQAENLLRSHEQQLRLALSSTQSGVWNWDLETDCMMQTCVKDTGCGIPPDQLHRVFDEFSKVPSTMPTSQGAQLGLFITKSFITMHKGHIWVESALGSGSRFYFTLPMSGLPRRAKRPA